MPRIRFTIGSGDAAVSGAIGGQPDDVEMTPAAMALAVLKGYVDREEQTGEKSQLPFVVKVEAEGG